MAADAIDPRFAEYARSGDPRLREQLILDNRGLAIAFARRYHHRGVAPDDLEQTALEALVRAVDRFDPQRGLRFSTYAGRTIDGELKQYFRDRTWDVRVPRSTRQLATGVRSISETLTQRLGRAPTASEIATALELDVADVVIALEASSAARAEPITDQSDVGATDGEFDRVDAAIVAPQLLERLSDDERRVVELRFYENRTQSEIAQTVGVSQMQISRVLQRALRRLRESIDDSS